MRRIGAAIYDDLIGWDRAHFHNDILGCTSRSAYRVGGVYFPRKIGASGNGNAHSVIVNAVGISGDSTAFKGKFSAFVRAQDNITLVRGIIRIAIDSTAVNIERAVRRYCRAARSGNFTLSTRRRSYSRYRKPTMRFPNRFLCSCFSECSCSQG